MAIHNVTILVDCEKIVRTGAAPSPDNPVIQMYADPSIVLNDPKTDKWTQGSYELRIKVNNQDDICWFPAPLFAYPTGVDAGSGQRYSVIVTDDKDYSSTPMLKNWTAYQGSGTVLTYQTDGDPIASDSPVVKGDFQPYVQAKASWPGQNLGTTSQPEAYTFYIDIYQGSTRLVSRYSWDPFVTVYVPS